MMVVFLWGRVLSVFFGRGREPTRSSRKNPFLNFSFGYIDLIMAAVQLLVLVDVWFVQLPQSLHNTTTTMRAMQ